MHPSFRHPVTVFVFLFQSAPKPFSSNCNVNFCTLSPNRNQCDEAVPSEDQIELDFSDIKNVLSGVTVHRLMFGSNRVSSMQLSSLNLDQNDFVGIETDLLGPLVWSAPPQQVRSLHTAFSLLSMSVRACDDVSLPGIASLMKAERDRVVAPIPFVGFDTRPARINRHVQAPGQFNTPGVFI